MSKGGLLHTSDSVVAGALHIMERGGLTAIKVEKRMESGEGEDGASIELGPHA